VSASGLFGSIAGIRTFHFPVKLKVTRVRIFQRAVRLACTRAASFQKPVSPLDTAPLVVGV
jgi:hypothetical protein